jgi:uncharacterized integral membrane protein
MVTSSSLHIQVSLSLSHMYTLHIIHTTHTPGIYLYMCVFLVIFIYLFFPVANVSGLAVSFFFYQPRRISRPFT